MEYAYLAWIVFLGALWGSSFTLIKVSVQGMPPFTLGAVRVVLAAIILLGYLRAKGERIPWSKKLAKDLIFVGIVNLGIPFAAICWGTQFIPSGVVGILNAVMPLICFVLAAVTGTEKGTWLHLAGVLVGFGGILVLMLPKIGGEPIAWQGAAAILLASTCYAIGTLYVRRHLTGYSPLVGVTGQTIFASLVLVPLAIAEKPWTMDITTSAIWIAIILAVVHTALGNLIYYGIIHRYGATRSSFTSYIIPFFSILWGKLFLDEVLGWNAFAALVLIIFGLALVNDIIKFPRKKQPVEIELNEQVVSGDGSES